MAELQRPGHRPVVAGQSAEDLWGIPMVGLSRPSTVTIIVESAPHVRRGRRDGVRVREANLPESHITTWGEPKVSVPLRTATDLVRLTVRSRESALSALIGAARTHLDHLHGLKGDPHAITEYVRQHRVHGSIHQALQEILHDAPKRGQGLVRGVMPLMEPRVEVVGASGRRCRVDVLRDDVIGEADGAVKYRSPKILWQEKLRQADREAGGDIVVRRTWEEIVRDPAAVAQRLHQALSTSHRLRDSFGRLGA